jgi:hypothetical protein
MMFSHVDVWKCHAHNRIIENRKSCDICVSSEREKLHMQGICNYEGVKASVTATVTPLKSPLKPILKAPYTRTSCGYKVSVSSADVPGFQGLPLHVRSAFTILDVTLDRRIWAVRIKYEKQIPEYPRMLSAFANDMWFDITKEGDIPYCADSHEKFMDHFKRAWAEGQRVIEIDAHVLPVPFIKVPKGTYKLNISSRHFGLYNRAGHTTRGCLDALDKYEGTLGPIRMLEQAKIFACSNNESREVAKQQMAEKLWDALLANKPYFYSTLKVKAQFVEAVIWFYTNGNQRLIFVEDEVAK